MKKSILYLFFITLVVFSSCGDGTSIESLPDASGRVDEIIVVMDDKAWEGESGKALRRVLTDAYPGLPQPEPRFDLNQVPPLGLEKILKRSSTIIYVGNLKDGGPTDKAIQEQVGRLEDKKPRYLFSVNDVWASPQQVIYLFGKDEEDLINVMDVKKEQIVNRIYTIEDRKAYRNAYAGQTNKGLSAYVKKNYDIEFRVPGKFEEIVKNDSMIWFRQELKLMKKGTEMSNIIIHSQPYEKESEFNLQYPINKRNELGKYVESEKEGARMTTEMKHLEPTQKKFKTEDGLEVIETRGLWKMTGDFMGGPFINYCIKDKKNKRIVTFDGFVYSPQAKKRRAMRKLESMYKTLKVN